MVFDGYRFSSRTMAFLMDLHMHIVLVQGLGRSIMSSVFTQRIFLNV